MSVALASMDSAYGLSLAMSGIHHHHHLLQLHHHHHHHRQQQQNQHLPAASDNSSSALRFSVVNILRPDFGRDAIVSGKTTSTASQPIKVPALQPRDLSVSSPRSSHSPLEGNVSNLSRSASLESLASSRSSVAGSSVNGSAPSTTSSTSSITSSDSTATNDSTSQQSLWPAWIYCTRYSDRPSSGPRSRRVKRAPKIKTAQVVPDEKRPRTAFSGEQLAKLRDEFVKNKYLNEERRQKLSRELGLNEQQIKIWFQNKRAKIKKSNGHKNPLALQLMAQGLYNHSTVPVDEDGEEISCS